MRIVLMCDYFVSFCVGTFVLDGTCVLCRVLRLLFFVWLLCFFFCFFFFSSRRRHTRWTGDWSSDVCSSDLNVVGPLGLLQSFADGLKVFLKETIIPSGANRGLFIIAPIITFTMALIGWAVVPFGPNMVLANINVGLLYLLAISSMGVYGVIIAR